MGWWVEGLGCGGDGGVIQQMAVCCLAGTQSWSGEAEAVSDVPPSGHCQEPYPCSPPPQQPQSQKLRIEEVLSHCM